MTPTQEKNLLVANTLIENFRKSFITITGHEVTILVNGLIYDPTRLSNVKKLSLIDLEYVINPFIPPESRFHTIRIRRNIRYLSDLRKIFTKIARDFGYTWQAIGDHFGQDHTTMMNNCQKANHLLDTSDEFRTLYFKIIKTLNDDFGIDDGDNQAESESEPALSNAMLS